METSRKNKMVASAPASKVEGQEYHFAGGNEYLPCTVVASSLEEAEQKWVEKRQPVVPVVGSDTQ